MKALPPEVAAYKRTPELREDTIPPALRRAHDTKVSAWGRIVVLEGELLYRILDPAVEETWLRPGVDGVVEPTVRHEVEAPGPVRFYVEFLR